MNQRVLFDMTELGHVMVGGREVALCCFQPLIGRHEYHLVPYEAFLHTVSKTGFAPLPEGDIEDVVLHICDVIPSDIDRILLLQHSKHQHSVTKHIIDRHCEPQAPVTFDTLFPIPTVRDVGIAVMRI